MPTPGLACCTRAAGAAVAATDLVLDGRAENAFCSVRPPGHHATRDTAMGFCFFNNVAIAARHALDVRGLKRVAIVDFDVHHGNGTEDIIAGDERVLMVSLFQHPLYPVQRRRAQAAPTWSTCRCRPTRAAPEVREMIEANVAAGGSERFKPADDLHFSAGFDAHRADELGQLGLVEADYEWITLQASRPWPSAIHKAVSCRCLEGGYDLGMRCPAASGSRSRVLADL